MEGSTSSSSSQGDHKFCVQSMLSDLRIALSFEAALVRPDRAWRLIAFRAAAAAVAAAAASSLFRLAILGDLSPMSDSDPSNAAAAVTASTSSADMSGLTTAADSSGVGALLGDFRTDIGLSWFAPLGVGWSLLDGQGTDCTGWVCRYAWRPFGMDEVNGCILCLIVLRGFVR